MDASADEVRLVVSLTLGPSEGRRVLGAADADADGTVSAAEADRYMAQWGDGLRTDLPVTVDGEQVEVTWAEPYFDPIGEVRSVDLSVEMVARVPLDEGRHVIAMRDGMRIEAFDRTDVAFQARDGATLVASGMSESPSSPTPRLAYGPDLPRPEGGHVITMIAEVPGTPDDAQPEWLWVIVAGAAVLAAILAAAVLRKRSR